MKNHTLRNEKITGSASLTLSLVQLEALINIISAYHTEWLSALSKSILEDDLSGIATAEAVLRKVEPILEALVQSRASAVQTGQID
jgi:hypothetical protein